MWMGKCWSVYATLSQKSLVIKNKQIQKPALPGNKTIVRLALVSFVTKTSNVKQGSKNTDTELKEG